MILVDTSVWVDAFNGKSFVHVEALTEMLLNDVAICITPTIVQEVLQGIRNDSDFERINYRLSGFHLLNLDSGKAAIEAAQIYRLLRKKGITIRKPNDCLIACYAINHSIEIMHNDSDFDLIAVHTPLSIFKF